MSSRLLLIFLKNPVSGSVKTRLAASIGNEKAVEIYNKLINHTVEASRQVETDIQLWYSSFIDQKDGFDGKRFKKRIQQGRDLGARMWYAFQEGFAEGYAKIAVIGSDCPDISPEILESAFRRLDENEVVLGPSEDGGYYLLGMNSRMPFLFSNIPWSTPEVFPETIRRLNERAISYKLLPELNDIDTADDLDQSGFV
ncbi:MAG: DUF2064 domain-containing protein [Bacteroidetes bacterium]|jgi:rSAM/selenodomain-associated transferase 1|nr:DUF2064 domain-containing protein [Bacteroidota bacterium]